MVVGRVTGHLAQSTWLAPKGTATIFASTARFGRNVVLLTKIFACSAGRNTSKDAQYGRNERKDRVHGLDPAWPVVFEGDRIEFVIIGGNFFP